MQEPIQLHRVLLNNNNKPILNHIRMQEAIFSVVQRKKRKMMPQLNNRTDNHQVLVQDLSLLSNTPETHQVANPTSPSAEQIYVLTKKVKYYLKNHISSVYNNKLFMKNLNEIFLINFRKRMNLP